MVSDFSIKDMDDDSESETEENPFESADPHKIELGPMEKLNQAYHPYQILGEDGVCIQPLNCINSMRIHLKLEEILK